MFYRCVITKKVISESLFNIKLFFLFHFVIDEFTSSYKIIYLLYYIVGVHRSSLLEKKTLSIFSCFKEEK